MPKTSPLVLHALTTGLGVPDSADWQADLTDPARSVMTDFHERSMVVVDGERQIDDALDVMKHAGVRSAFVLDGLHTVVVGLVTAYDILGEKPLRHLHSIGCRPFGSSRRDVVVADIMEPVETWKVVRLADVDAATVGCVLDAFKRTGRTHLPVVEGALGEAPRLRGVFSAAKLMRLTEETRTATKSGIPAAPMSGVRIAG
jgi:CBS domain-containing protein